jgi:hypothetical protein
MATVSKDVFLLGMSVQIEEHLHPSVVEKDVTFDIVYFLAALELWPFPAAVEIVSRQVTAGVAENDAVWVDHGDDFDDVLFEQLVEQVRSMFLFGVVDEESIYLVEDALHYVGACSFDWMGAAHDEDDLLVVDGEVEGMGDPPGRDGEHFDCVVEIGAAQLTPLEVDYVMLVLLILAGNLVQQSSHSRITVRLIIRYKDLLTLVQIHCKLKCVKVFRRQKRSNLCLTTDLLISA